MQKDDIIQDFCELSTLVGDHMQYSHDCFCNETTVHFKFDKEIMQFIKDAVREKIRRIDDGTNSNV